jgi:hypothetical protein
VTISELARNNSYIGEVIRSARHLLQGNGLYRIIEARFHPCPALSTDKDQRRIGFGLFLTFMEIFDVQYQSASSIPLFGYADVFVCRFVDEHIRFHLMTVEPRTQGPADNLQGPETGIWEVGCRSRTTPIERKRL